MTIICGGRDFVPTEADCAALNEQKGLLPITEVVSGKAKGADAFGEWWASEHGIPVKEFPANWALYGRSAGPIRNRQMAEYADALIAFPGGRGTSHMIQTAKELGLTIIDLRKK
jgi:hypothetical protein